MFGSHFSSIKIFNSFFFLRGFTVGFRWWCLRIKDASQSKSFNCYDTGYWNDPRILSDLHVSRRDLVQSFIRFIYIQIVSCPLLTEITPTSDGKIIATELSMLRVGIVNPAEMIFRTLIVISRVTRFK